MSKIQVKIINKTTLEICEEAHIGDIIDLEELTRVDTTLIEEAINLQRDKIYEKKLEEQKQIERKLHEAEITKLNTKLEELSRQNELNLKTKEQELLTKYQEEITALKMEIAKLKLDSENNTKNNETNIQLRLNEQEKTLVLKYNEQITKLKNELEILKQTQESKIKEIMAQTNALHLEELTKQKEELSKIIKEKEELIQTLQRQKASLNVKQTGEDLESWCNNEVLSYMQTGLFNCTWKKDNEVVRDDGEEKGSKADFIFKIFTTNEHKLDELLASICLEMKDENPDSVNKKTNASYFKALDKNRNKKGCRYAVLVSNLETDKPNDLPIYKVLEYEDMYVVRPAYMMTFLNMIVSLTTRFSQLILTKTKEDLELKNQTLLMEEFNSLKETYLDKPLASLQTILEDVYKKTETIKKAASMIDDDCEKIKSSYIRNIEEKLRKFEIKLNGITKKMDGEN